MASAFSIFHLSCAPALKAPSLIPCTVFMVDIATPGTDTPIAMVAILSFVKNSDSLCSPAAAPSNPACISSRNSSIGPFQFVFSEKFAAALPNLLLARLSNQPPTLVFASGFSAPFISFDAYSAPNISVALSIALEAMAPPAASKRPSPSVWPAYFTLPSSYPYVASPSILFCVSAATAGSPVVRAIPIPPTTAPPALASPLVAPSVTFFKPFFKASAPYFLTARLVTAAAAFLLRPLRGFNTISIMNGAIWPTIVPALVQLLISPLYNSVTAAFIASASSRAFSFSVRAPSPSSSYLLATRCIARLS